MKKQQSQGEKVLQRWWQMVVQRKGCKN